jgi:uncharacterized paraquat-inducible protein A
MSELDSARKSGVDCPSCRVRLGWIDINFADPFRCPACGSMLRVPESYNLGSGLVALAATILLTYFVGARGFVWPGVANAFEDVDEAGVADFA